MQIFASSPRNVRSIIVYISLFRMRNDCLELGKMWYWLLHESSSLLDVSSEFKSNFISLLVHGITKKVTS